jgi:hypothetical protein
MAVALYLRVSAEEQRERQSIARDLGGAEESANVILVSNEGAPRQGHV